MTTVGESGSGSGSMDLQVTVKEALATMYHHPDETARRRADRWLQEFHRTLDAWQVADSLLHDPSSNTETVVFCSQTLRIKVQRDFEELPSSAFRSLQDSLIALLRKLSNGLPKVRTQICLAVAALAVQVPAEDWGCGGVVNWLSEEMKLHPEYSKSYLELLSVLPEEIYSYKIAARPERRRQFEQELVSSADVALHLLTSCLAADELKDQVLEGFSSWIRLCNGIDPVVLASHPLVQATLSSLSNNQHLETAVNATSQLIQFSISRGNSSNVVSQLPLIQVILPHVMCLKDRIRDSSEDEDDLKAIARLFADVGDSYVELIAMGSNEAVQVVQALLEVTSHPEIEISSMTYNFWHSLQFFLIRQDSHAAGVPLDVERNRRLQIFRPAFEYLVALASSRVEYPEDYHDLSEEDSKDFHHRRVDASDLLLDANEVLGGELTLKILFTKLVSSCNNNLSYKWQPIEAALFCIRTIAKSIPTQESVILPQVMAMLSKLPHEDLLFQTICSTIGAYSKWIDASPVLTSVLSSLIEILVKGMSISEGTAEAASAAFKCICKDCRKKLASSLDGLIQIYQMAITEQGGCKVPAESSIHLVEALCVVINELSEEQAKAALELVCMPTVTSLQGVINQGVAILREIPARQLIVHIDRLGCIFKNVRLPDVIAGFVNALWPMFKVIFDERAWDMRTMESLCRSCKYAVRTCGRSIGLMITVMLEEIRNLYPLHSQSCFLYLSSEVIKIFGSDPSCADYLRTLIEALFTHSMNLLKTIDDVTIRPDVADDCFLLASRCIRYCPDVFIPSSVFPLLVDCAMAGMTVQHRDACKSILSFLSDIFEFMVAPAAEKYQGLIQNVVLPRGASMTRILIACLTGALPSSRTEDVSCVLVSMSRVYREEVLSWARKSISLLPHQVLTEAERASFLKALYDMGCASSAEAADNTFREFSDVCRRNSTVEDIIQGALRPLELNIDVA